jgi:hypothetical protein
MRVSSEAAKKFCDERIAALSAEIESLKAWRAALNNESLTEQFVSLLAAGNGQKHVADGKAPKGNFAKVVAYFHSVNNEWKTTKEIMAGAGVDRGNLSNMLYKAQKQAFECLKDESSGGSNMWRLKDATAISAS